MEIIGVVSKFWKQKKHEKVIYRGGNWISIPGRGFLSRAIHDIDLFLYGFVMDGF